MFLAAADVEVEQAAGKAAFFDFRHQFAAFNRDNRWVFLGAINDARNHAGSAGSAGGPFSSPLSHLRGDHMLVAHRNSPMFSVGKAH